MQADARVNASLGTHDAEVAQRKAADGENDERAGPFRRGSAEDEGGSGTASPAGDAHKSTRTPRGAGRALRDPTGAELLAASSFALDEFPVARTPSLRAAEAVRDLASLRRSLRLGQRHGDGERPSSSACGSFGAVPTARHGSNAFRPSRLSLCRSRMFGGCRDRRESVQPTQGGAAQTPLLAGARRERSKTGQTIHGPVVRYRHTDSLGSSFRFHGVRFKFMKRFSSELIAILAVGAALAGLVLQQGHRLDNRIDALAARMDEQDRRTNDRFLRLTGQLTGQMNEQYRQLNERMDERFRQLTAQMNERFLQVDERFRQVDERFRQVDERFQQIDERFRQVDERFQQIDEQIRNLSERIARVEGKFDLFETVIARRNESPTKLPTESVE